jgi:hypothetical protein
MVGKEKFYMSLQKGNVTQTNAVEIGAGLDSALQNLPTINISTSGTISLAAIPGTPGGIRCLNFIRGVSVVLASSSLVNGQLLLFISTGAVGPVRISLDNGGTIAGSSVYTLAGPIQLSYDGTNLS